MQLLLRVHIDTRLSDHDWADISLYANDRDTQVNPIRLPEGASAAESISIAMLAFVQALTSEFTAQLELPR
jgi:hypothetical protein